MRKALKESLHFKREAACVAFARLWEFLPWGANTVILEQKDMELVTISSVYIVYMETMSVFWYFHLQAVPSWCCSLGSLGLPWKDLLPSPEVLLCENLKFDIDRINKIFHCCLEVMKNKFSLCQCLCHLSANGKTINGKTISSFDCLLILALQLGFAFRHLDAYPCSCIKGVRHW